MGDFIQTIGGGIAGLISGAFGAIGGALRGMIASANTALPGGLFALVVFVVLFVVAWNLVKR